ncbi:MAG: hypothetical protein A2Y40_05335 [Candidatus Margulisbacteria bacterium GWF2_35_9]|nr:MAG: hypothetical protein A2Y40_05335 [Candidatus Margulisbacteria bacterium GWF2_35_9]
MENYAEDKVSKFYRNVGWETEGEDTEDAKRFEDLRENAREYVSKCRLRVLRHIPESGDNILDMASGPIQFKEYFEYSKQYKKRYCVDLSSKALDDAKRKIGDHGVFLCGSFFDLDLEKDFFDCSISLHTIYHIDKDKQEEAVRKLINVTKPGKPVIIVYSNPHAIMNYIALPLRTLKKVVKWLIRRKKKTEFELYFSPHSNSWWKRFEDVADVQILPWRSFASSHQKSIFPNNKFGKKMLDILFKMEDRFPKVFAGVFQYPMIILTKKV